ncbi:hypothetical protein CLU79DRAFT_730387 [Phycomyces nitens]|nr:hypothetical protein CLU79DRAFT_730387 [Phycomyces nitens]
MWASKDRINIYNRFRDIAKDYPERDFVIFEGKPYTFKEIERASNKLARWFLTQDVKVKDTVCMMHQNHPTFYIIFFAILKIGAIPAMINTSLTNASLTHVIKIAQTKLFVFDPCYIQSVGAVENDIRELGISLFAYGEATENSNIDPLSFAPVITPQILADFADANLSENFTKGIISSDPALLIYTSGTTGLPKAAIMEHARMNFAMDFYGTLAELTVGSRLYCVLPLYHGSGILFSTFATMVRGGTVVLGRRFSAKRFWDDCVENKVTAFSYIGEFCRYLLSQPIHPMEAHHQVKSILGNGMRPEIWNRFRERFGITTIVELYSASEAPTSLMNVNKNDFGAGAVGHRGMLFRTIRRDIRIIQVDPTTEEPVRTKDGLCKICKPGQYGELVVFVNKNAIMQFRGYYKNEEATTKKVMHDVLKKGDSYFRSGDLLKLDRHGFFYFADRLGDTFRWKGENVATTEVTQVVSQFAGIEESNVYGVEVPSHDGRAGMVAIVVKEGHSIDFGQLHDYLAKNLPRYAIPIFIRILPSMQMTETFKQLKTVYRSQGIDMSLVPKTEPIYWLKDGVYVPFTDQDWHTLNNGKAKL